VLIAEAKEESPFKRAGKKGAACKGGRGGDVEKVYRVISKMLDQTKTPKWQERSVEWENPRVSSGETGALRKVVEKDRKHLSSRKTGKNHGRGRVSGGKRGH